MRAILTWHSIDGSGSPISVSREEFARAAGWLAASGVRVTGVPELLASPHARGCRRPHLRRRLRQLRGRGGAPAAGTRGWPVTLFVVTGHVGRDNRWRGAARRPESRRCRCSTGTRWRGSARRGSASPRIPGRTPASTRCDEGQLAEELAGCADDLEQTARHAPDGFGVSLRRRHAAARRRPPPATYAWACTTDLRVLGARGRPVPPAEDRCLVSPRPGTLRTVGVPSRLRGWFWLRHGGRRLKSALRATARP